MNNKVWAFIISSLGLVVIINLVVIIEATASKKDFEKNFNSYMSSTDALNHTEEISENISSSIVDETEPVLSEVDDSTIQINTDIDIYARHYIPNGKGVLEDDIIQECLDTIENYDHWYIYEDEHVFDLSPEEVNAKYTWISPLDGVVYSIGQIYYAADVLESFMLLHDLQGYDIYKPDYYDSNTISWEVQNSKGVVFQIELKWQENMVTEIFLYPVSDHGDPSDEE